MTDSDLLNSAKAGDQDAFERLRKQYDKQIVMPNIRRYMGYKNAEEFGEDISNDVWLAALENLPTFWDIQSFRGWLKKVAHNIAINAQKRLHPEIVVQPGTGDRDDPDTPSSPEYTPRPRRGLAPEKSHDIFLFPIAVDRVWSRMNERDRMIINLRREGYSADEVAKMVSKDMKKRVSDDTVYNVGREFWAAVSQEFGASPPKNQTTKSKTAYPD
jgi:RNA polymerase sigma factor (sigma-70 family)